MEDRQGRVHIREEEFDAVLDHLVREQARRRREGRTTWRAVDTV